MGDDVVDGYPLYETDNGPRPGDGPQEPAIAVGFFAALLGLVSPRVSIVNRALRYVGIHENPMGSNNVIFGSKFGMNFVAWCQEFAWVVLHECGVNVFKSASTQACVANARRNGTWHKGLAGIKPGDSVYFHWPNSSRASDQPDHVEIVVRTISGGLVDVGGNVSDAVRQTTRRANFLGYIRYGQLDPKPTPAPKPVPVPPKPAPTGDQVMAHVAALRHHWYSFAHSYSVPAGALVSVKSTFGAWALVSYNGRLGWVAISAFK